MADETTTPQTAPIATQEPVKGFPEGYSAGKAEGFAAALKALGVESLDAAMSLIRKPEKDASPTAPKTITESEEYRALATEFRATKERHDETTKELDRARKLADQARVEKLKSVARIKGVGEKQLDQFARLFGDVVQLSDDGEKLEVLSRMPDGNLVRAGQSVDEYVEKMANENPWFLGPKQPQGGGTKPSERPGEYQNQRNVPMFYDSRPLNERMKK